MKSFQMVRNDFKNINYILYTYHFNENTYFIHNNKMKVNTQPLIIIKKGFFKSEIKNRQPI